MELAFAALQQLCAPMLDRLDRLPGPQRDALGVAFGLRAGDAPDRFLVGLAVLSLLAEVAEEQPLVCVVDDAQWLDRASAQALVFVARRLFVESVALLLVTRDPGDELEGLPSSWSRACVTVMRARCWARRCGCRWMSGCGSGSSRRRTATRWRCWSCRGGRRRLSWRAVSVCWTRRGCRADRGQLPPEARGAPGRDSAAVAGRGGGAGRRPGAAVARGRAARDRRPGGIRHRRVAHDRRERDLSSPAGPLLRVSGGLAGGQAGGASRAGGSDRSRGRSRSPRLASRPGDAGARRGSRVRA